MPKSRRRKRKKSGPPPGFKRIKLPPQAMAVLAEQKKAFIAKFGREPRENEPVFFDPDADEPREMDADYFEGEILRALGAAGVDPAIAYAFRKTGLLLDESLGVEYDPADLREWKEAIAEYRRTHSKADASPTAEPRGERVVTTELPEILGAEFGAKDLDQVTRCLGAIDEVMLEGATTFVKMEIAAALIVLACSSAFDSADADGEPEEGPARYHTMEDLILRRAREIYAQGHG